MSFLAVLLIISSSAKSLQACAGARAASHVGVQLVTPGRAPGLNPGFFSGWVVSVGA
jgi:hypothetical protein